MGKDDLLKDVCDALVGLDEPALNAKVDVALSRGVNPVTLIESGIAVGLRTLGEKFQRGEVFIPHLAVASDVARKQMEKAKSFLAAGESFAGGPTVILGTVRDDIHDLGKNLVGALLSVSGFRVVDLGKDVPEERFVDEARRSGQALIGMSALMTTTMINQRSVIKALEKAGLRGGVGVMVGGAPTSASWAREIGADGHADNVVTAVRLASALAGRFQARGDEEK